MHEDFRSPFAKVHGDFDPTGFLNIFEAATYSEPRLLRLPCASQHPVPRAYQSGSQQGLLDYLQKWDNFDRLELVDASDVAPKSRGTLFPVPKSEFEDRIVFNCIQQNAEEGHLAGASIDTPAGHQLTELIIPQGSVARISADDLSDCFPAFRGSLARAKRNARVHR